jgi:hypothetical protein
MDGTDLECLQSGGRRTPIELSLTGVRSFSQPEKEQIQIVIPTIFMMAIAHSE